MLAAHEHRRANGWLTAFQVELSWQLILELSKSGGGLILAAGEFCAQRNAIQSRARV
jgi:hypothetical protein